MDMKYKKMTIEEFRKIKAGDTLFYCENGIYKESIAAADSIYNYDADVPDWEVECKDGLWVCWDSAYTLNGKYAMRIDFHIDVEPVSITFKCPHCNHEQTIEWKYVDAPTCWEDDWGAIQCPECEKKIELGDYEYD